MMKKITWCTAAFAVRRKPKLLLLRELETSGQMLCNVTESHPNTGKLWLWSTREVKSTSKIWRCVLVRNIETWAIINCSNNVVQSWLNCELLYSHTPAHSHPSSLSFFIFNNMLLLNTKLRWNYKWDNTGPLELYAVQWLWYELTFEVKHKKSCIVQKV